jgi:hypothetical protein
MNIRYWLMLILFAPLMLVPAAGSIAQGLILAQADAMTHNIAVTQAVVCRNVVDRMPVGISDVFPASTQRVFCFTRIDGAQGETEITHNWYYKGALKASVVLPVRGSEWRTWSSKTLLPQWTGEWMVEVLSKDGTPLESVTFSVQ